MPHDPKPPRPQAQPGKPGGTPPPPPSAQRPPAPSRPKREVLPKVKSRLFRNVLIIIILGVAIWKVWELTERRKQEAAKQLPPKPAPAKPVTVNIVPPPPEPEPDRTAPATSIPRPAESPMESLERLRAALARGERAEMPVSTIRRGNCRYLFIPTKMSWTEAAWFAEEHGGHLAVPSKDAPVSWILKDLANSQAMWLGAARTGTPGPWASQDGTMLAAPSEPLGSEPYLGIDNQGRLRSGSNRTRIPFAIQWHDRSNPAALPTVLARTATSVRSGEPKFPPGTRTFGDRAYLLITRDVTWQEASNLATMAGGHLAVASSGAEMTAVRKIVDELPDNHRVWFGASFENGAWSWCTREPWQKLKWAPEAGPEENDVGLAVRSTGWDRIPLAQQAHGFVIEWDNP